MHRLMNILALFFVLVPANKPYAGTPTEIYKKIQASVYQVIVLKKHKNAEKQGQTKTHLTSLGSAVAITSNLLLTNCHVLTNEDAIIFIKTKNKHSLAIPVDGDIKKDICVLYVRGKLKPVNIRTISEIEIGETVYAIGSPYPFNQLFTNGIVSGIVEDPKLGKIIQITAHIDRGSSGGGLFDVNGNLIGLTTGILAKVNFAVSLDWVKKNLLYLEDSQEKDVLASQTIYRSPHIAQSHSDMRLIGVFGTNKIALYKTKIGCLFKIPGRTKRGNRISAAYWFANLPNTVFYYPSSINSQLIFNQLKMIRKSDNDKIYYSHSKDFVLLKNRKIPLSFAKLKNDTSIKAHLFWFAHSPTQLFLRGKYFITVFISKNQNFYLPVYFGLYGFGEAYENYTRYCKH